MQSIHQDGYRLCERQALLQYRRNRVNRRCLSTFLILLACCLGQPVAANSDYQNQTNGNRSQPLDDTFVVRDSDENEESNAPSCSPFLIDNISPTDFDTPHRRLQNFRIYDQKHYVPLELSIRARSVFDSVPAVTKHTDSEHRFLFEKDTFDLLKKAGLSIPKAMFFSNPNGASAKADLERIEYRGYYNPYEGGFEYFPYAVYNVPLSKPGEFVSSRPIRLSEASWYWERMPHPPPNYPSTISASGRLLEIQEWHSIGPSHALVSTDRATGYLLILEKRRAYKVPLHYGRIDRVRLSDADDDSNPELLVGYQGEACYVDLLFTIQNGKLTPCDQLSGGCH